MIAPGAGLLDQVMRFFPWQNDQAARYLLHWEMGSYDCGQGVSGGQILYSKEGVIQPGVVLN